MAQKIIYQGAEAKISLDSKKNLVTKNRIKKSYRIPELDGKLRKSRTKKESKLLLKASKIINTPLLVDCASKYQLKMQFIKGKKLSEYLDKHQLNKQKAICRQIGKDIAMLHKQNIIHGDLTTSNMILGRKKKNKIFFIDFGLGLISNKIEDKAVDLHLLKQALEAKHFEDWEKLWKAVESGYLSINKTESKKVLERLKAVEKRGRYKKNKKI